MSLSGCTQDKPYTPARGTDSSAPGVIWQSALITTIYVDTNTDPVYADNADGRHAIGSIAMSTLFLSAPPMIPRRLDKYLADATDLSRSEIEAAFEKERIEVKPSQKPRSGDYELWSLIFADDDVYLDGERVAPTTPRHYFALHKPENVISTADHPKGRPCLKPWLDELPDPVFPVGRLDRMTTGMLLFVDDGDLCYCLLRPWFHVEKEYRLTVQGIVDPGDERLATLEDGVDIGDGNRPAKALRTAVVDGTDGATELSVVIDEGRHRVIRRMARRTGLDLRHLHRHRIGPVELGDLPAGDYRRLSDAEVDALWDACGGRQASKERQIAALRRQADKWRDQDRPHHRLERWLTQNKCL